jgi:hypothetical protein
MHKALQTGEHAVVCWPGRSLHFLTIATFPQMMHVISTMTGGTFTCQSRMRPALLRGR